VPVVSEELVKVDELVELVVNVDPSCKPPPVLELPDPEEAAPSLKPPVDPNCKPPGVPNFKPPLGNLKPPPVLSASSLLLVGSFRPPDPNFSPPPDPNCSPPLLPILNPVLDGS